MGHKPSMGRRLFRPLAASLLALGFVCGASSAWSAEKMVIALNGGTASAYPFYVGKAKGLFAAAGVDLSFVKTTTPAATAAAAASGDADLAVSGLSAGFFNTAANGDFAVLGQVTTLKPGYLGTVIVASNAGYAKGIKSGPDLRGTRAGLGSLGAGMQYFYYLLAQKYGFPYESMSLVSLGGDANVIAAVKANAIDVGSVSGTFAVDAEKAGLAKIILKIDNEFPGPQFILFTGTKTLATRRAALVDFMKGYLKTTALYADAFEKRDANGNFARTPEANELLDIISKETGLPDDAVAQGITYVPPDPTFDPAEVSRQIAVWRKLNLIDPKVDPNMKLVDNSILASAQGK